MRSICCLKRLCVFGVSSLLLAATYADDVLLGQGERADWMRGSWGALWLPERNFNGNIEGVRIDDFLAQISHLKTIDYVQVALASPNIFSPVHTGPHPIIESLWQGDTDTNGDPINLVVPRASVDDPLMSWLEAIDAAGLRSEIYVNSYNLLARNPEDTQVDYPDISDRWENYCDTDPTVQAFINSHPYLQAGDPDRRKYMFCYAEFILKEYSLRYGDLIDAWCFDSADNIMEDCGDDAESGILDDQRIYEAFADACHAGNPNAAISFNNSVGVDGAPLATPTLFDDYTFGHPFGGAGNMVVPEILYTRNFAIVEYIQDHNGLPFATTDTRDWNDDVVGHFFPKQSTTSWNAGAAPCLTDAQFVEWTAEGCINGGAITWGTPLVRTNLENSPVLTLQPYALTQLEAVDLHFRTSQFPGVPNWRRADTPLPVAAIGAPYSHTLTDGVDFWDPSGGSITGFTLVNAPSWLSVAESSPGSGDWVLSGTPTETIETEYCFDLRIAIGAAETSRTVHLKVNESPIMPTTSLSINGGADWLDTGYELTYDNNGTTNQNRAISYSTESFQSDGGFKLTTYYTTDYIAYLGEANFSFGLVRVDTDLSTYTGLNPFGADATVYSLGANLTSDLGSTLRGLNFTDGSTITTLDTSGTNVQFVTDASTEVVIEIDQNGAWSYSINGIVEATGVIAGGFDLSSSYRVVVYGQDDYAAVKSIQSLDLELKPYQVAGLVAHWTFDEGSGSTTTADITGNGHDGIISNTSWVPGYENHGLAFNGTSSQVTNIDSAFSSLSDQITISLWAYGDSSLPTVSSIIYAVNSSGNRVLNVHLPYSNGTIFWDAGDSGFDRISKAAVAAEYEGSWAHWVFTKNANTGVMNIYRNGTLWHSGTGNTKTMTGITAATIGSNISSAYYTGNIDEVQLYDIELDATEVANLYASYPSNPTYTLTYTAGSNGIITGTSSQAVSIGNDGTALTAVPHTNFYFVDWSDASTDNPRTDLSVTGNITVTANFAAYTGLENWRLTHFGSYDNTSNAADTADSDIDSSVNLLEYAFGTNPNVSDASTMAINGTSFTPGAPIVIIDFSPLSVKARFIRLEDHLNSGIGYTAQFSHDLSIWESVNGRSAVRIPSTSAANGYEAVELNYPIFLSNGRKARFYRMQINETASGNTQP
ncbi:MAG: LamG-like jellyroll fold domain-containing protein [Opitutaceae bacterium]